MSGGSPPPFSRHWTKKGVDTQYNKELADFWGVLNSPPVIKGGFYDQRYGQKRGFFREFVSGLSRFSGFICLISLIRLR